MSQWYLEKQGTQNLCLWYFSCNDQWRSQDYCKYIVALCFVVVEEEIGLVLEVPEKTKMC